MAYGMAYGMAHGLAYRTHFLELKKAFIDTSYLLGASAPSLTKPNSDRAVHLEQDQVLGPALNTKDGIAKILKTKDRREPALVAAPGFSASTIHPGACQSSPTMPLPGAFQRLAHISTVLINERATSGSR